ncbi:hypothetical protein MSAN_00663200 [Mycena sanguinolenta]|uniref:Uncharacterized protein n=1 Tax=Mycena sanguinolenta TaxID=230812 RepID=A0A8H7DFH9_9AGAR|nr:hypothetical protein MSAN_00663200 [Mycena sanguinolenta]
MTRFLVPLLLGAAFHRSLAQNTTAEPEACTVQAWVRAEDLSPNYISRGELRIKVRRQECADQVASVALRLQLDEFSEFKSLKSGAVLPDILPANRTTSADWMGSDVVYDYQAHDDGLSDPELWTVKAEERHAWMTGATLLHNNPDLTQPIVTPFTVAVPAVNYPPVNYEHRHFFGPVARHSFSILGYRYVAVVKFTDGLVLSQARTRGSTAFEESKCRGGGSDSTSKKIAEDAEKFRRCLPESQRSAFSAEIFLEDGKVVHKGRALKGRVTVHHLKAGSTTMSEISVGLRSRQRNHWAQAQAATGGDHDFVNGTFAMCKQWSFLEAIDIESFRFAIIFDEHMQEGRIQLGPIPVSKVVTPERPYVDFELQIPPDTPVDFASYYTAIENELDIRLTVLYSQEVAECIHPHLSSTTENNFTGDAAADLEEGFWDSFTRVGESIEAKSKPYRTMVLHAAVAITVLPAGGSTTPVAHYLAPGLEALAPVLRRGAEVTMPDPFPVAQPVFTVEALVNTSARLMQTGSTDPSQIWQQHWNTTWTRGPDPAEDYLSGPFAGLLWKKKMVAEERGILPSGSQVVEGDPHDQQPFSTAT